MWMNHYVQEKLLELDKERERLRLTPQAGPKRSKPALGPALRLAGRALRRMGEGLESWGSPAEPCWEERRLASGEGG